MPVKDVYSFSNMQGIFLVSGGWDGIVKFFRIDKDMTQQIGETNLFKPIHYMSGSYPLLVTAHSEKFLNIWNLETINQTFNPVTVRESPLKYATSSLCCFPQGRGMAVGSIEGRCGIINIDLRNPDTL
jgi:mRNA export factor